MYTFNGIYYRFTINATHEWCEYIHNRQLRIFESHCAKHKFNSITAIIAINECTWFYAFCKKKSCIEKVANIKFSYAVKLVTSSFWVWFVHVQYEDWVVILRMEIVVPYKWLRQKRHVVTPHRLRGIIIIMWWTFFSFHTKKKQINDMKIYF